MESAPDAAGFVAFFLLDGLVLAEIGVAEDGFDVLDSRLAAFSALSAELAEFAVAEVVV